VIELLILVGVLGLGALVWFFWPIDPRAAADDGHATPDTAGDPGDTAT
jgi:hypothetical protein